MDDLTGRRVRKGLAPPWAMFEPPGAQNSRCVAPPLTRPSLWTRARSWFHFHNSLMSDLQRYVKRMTGAEMQRDAAISLLIETPVECGERAPLPGRCGKCWPCRVDKFLRDAGARR